MVLKTLSLLRDFAFSGTIREGFDSDRSVVVGYRADLFDR